MTRRRHRRSTALIVFDTIMIVVVLVATVLFAIGLYQIFG